METLGRHVIAEMDGCNASALRDPKLIREFMLEAAQEAGARALADEMFEFRNGGVSGFVLLAESHISIHTWPEHCYAAIDVYTCGAHTMPDSACAHLAARLGASSSRLTILNRGLPGERTEHDHEIVVRRHRLAGPPLASATTT